MVKNHWKELRWLLVPIIALGLWGIYSDYKSHNSGLILQSTFFLVNRNGGFDNHSMLHFDFWVTYRGQKPQWWGNKHSLLKITSFEFRDRNGQLVTAVPFVKNNQKLGKLFFSSGGYAPSRTAYVANVSMAIAPALPVNGGTIKATLRVVDTQSKSSPKAYAEYKVGMTAKVDCNYEGC